MEIKRVREELLRQAKDKDALAWVTFMVKFQFPTFPQSTIIGWYFVLQMLSLKINELAN